MSYVLAFLGFAALILLHEAGHFVAAKAVGMRVERFSLFFGPMVWKVRRGETEYGIAAIPLGGYVKITGMNPREEIPEEAVPRAYYNQKVWKRIVVILAGPFVNLVIAFLIIWILLMSNGQTIAVKSIGTISKGTPAAAVLKPGDRLVSVDGVSSSTDAIRAQIRTHKCAGTPMNGCQSATPAQIVVRRGGQLVHVTAYPKYVAADKAVELGFAFDTASKPIGPVHAAGLTVSDLWNVTTRTVGVVVRIFQPQERKQLGSVVGGYTVTQQSFAHDTTQALEVLALISLSLAIINLFPFLPLDGGHVFWAVAEKIRGRRIPFEVMERAGVVGFALILMLFVIGLSNDISTLTGKGFNVR
jgi:regulator of sigma E protease